MFAIVVLPVPPAPCAAARRSKQLDVGQMAVLFRAMFPGLKARQLRLLISYLCMMDVEKDGWVRPDEVLQLLRTIPLRAPHGLVYQLGFRNVLPEAPPASPYDLTVQVRRGVCGGGVGVLASVLRKPQVYSQNPTKRGCALDLAWRSNGCMDGYRPLLCTLLVDMLG